METPKPGRINIVIPKEVHTAARIYAITHDLTMAEIVALALKSLYEKSS